jgi:hypothetical protein
MPKRFSNVPEHLREPHEVAWTDLPPIYWKVFGIALLLGMLTATAWIAWKLFEVTVLK